MTCWWGSPRTARSGRGMGRGRMLLAVLLAGCSPQPAGPPAALPAAPGAEVAEGWTTYADPSGFSVRHPESLVILPETDPLPDLRPPLVHRVRFLGRELAAADTAALEPPQLSVEVFAAPPGPLRQWLEAHGRLPGGAGVQVVTVPGAREALLVRDPRQLAPNEFLWVTTDRYAFLVVALGPDGEAMRSSFRLLDAP